MRIADSSGRAQLLTEREHAILRGMAEGYTDQVIANDLNLSVHTVKWYARRIYRKLKAKRRTQAVAVARSKGLLVDDRELTDGSIPAPPVPLVGRAAEIEALFRLLTDEAVRLVTVVGPGGIGKTRLGLEVALRWGSRTSTPCCFVSLEKIADPDDLPRVIGTKLGVQFSGTASHASQVLDRVGDLSGLLVVDNFEHLIPASPFISELLTVSPDLSILTTSRERLNIEPETLFQLDGLAYSSRDISLEKLSAIQLFCQTMRRLKPDFTPDRNDLRHIADICQRVEGMPLAIRMAAAWTRALSLRTIVDELDSNLDLLRTAMRDLPRRQRSMRRVFEGSWKLASEQERAVFIKLTVFRGGFDLAAAQAVAGASLPVIASLLDRSLLMQTDGDRYRIHALLRQFGAEKLNSDPGDLLDRTLDAYCRYYGSIMARFEQKIVADMSAFAREYLRLKADIENIFAAWHHALERPLLNEIGSFSYGVAYLYGGLGMNEQGRQTMLQALDQFRRHPEQATVLDWVIVHTAAGWFSANTTRYGEGLGYLQAAQELAAEIEDQGEAHVGLMKAYLSNVNHMVGDTARAREVGEEALAYCRDTGHEWGEWVSLVVLGDLEAGEGNYEQALVLHQQALALAEVRDYIPGVAYALPAVGMDWCTLKEGRRAVKAFQKALQMNRRLYVTDPIFMTLLGIAMLKYQQGAYQIALELAAILSIDTRIGGSPRIRTNLLLEKLRGEIPAEAYNAAMNRAEKGLISTPYVDSNFNLKPSLIDHLLRLLEEDSLLDQE